ncbi:MAG: FtsX-like permease family protein [Tissierellia bacterium]|nr:FtsX-like permease family protein [Tissierellia bacterium]
MVYKKIIFNEIKSSKLISVTILAFFLLTSYLLSTSGIIIANLTSSINHLMEASKTPHYLQMHIGDLDAEKMDKFAKAHENVADYHVQGFLNVDSSDIFINGNRFANNSQDNGFSVQNKNFDFLLDLNGEKVYPNEGEVYIPFAYFLNGEISEGDTLTINELDLTVKGPIRDSQMNSTLSSSKRFLIHKNDYEKLIPFGRMEYLIEFLLVDLGKITEFEGDYNNANLESNGPTITYSLFKLINAINDGIMIAILFLISILVLIISFLCIRFTLISKIEEEYLEIGILKAIGIRNKDIKKIYIVKYFVLAAIGGILGFVLSLITSNSFLKPIKLAMGNSGLGLEGYLLGFFLSFLAFVITMMYVNHILNLFKKMSPVKAIKTETTEYEKYGSEEFKLHKQVFMGTNVFLGLKNVFSRKKLYITFALVLIISAFIMILPNNIYSTISSRNFISYMGVGQSDILITIQGGVNKESNIKDLIKDLEKDTDIADFTVKNGKKYEVKLDGGVLGRLQLVSGDHNKFPPAYVSGEIPKLDNEISLSYLSATELNKNVGDSITLLVGGVEKELTVTGIYSDITNGGKTGNISFADDAQASLWSSIPITLKEDVNPSEKVEYYKNNFKDIKVTDIEDYIGQIFGSTISSVNKAAILSIIFSIYLTFLITLLFVKMLVIKDKRGISILKSLGFSSNNIKLQYLIGSALLVLLGIILGTILAGTLGQFLTSKLIGVFGVVNFKFNINYLFVFLITPAVLGIFVYIATIFGLRDIPRMRISEFIKE